MSYDIVKRLAEADVDDVGLEKNKLAYGPNGETLTYKLRIKSMRADWNPPPGTKGGPYFACDFEILESESMEARLRPGEECGVAWSFGGDWGHLALPECKRFLAHALGLPLERQKEIDDPVILLCASDDNPCAGNEVICHAAKKVRGPRSLRAGEPFVKLTFLPVKDVI